MNKKQYKEVFRFIENIHFNDFNKEPEYVTLKYDLDEERDVIRRKGWNNWHKNTNDIIFSEQEAKEILNKRTTRK